MIDWSKSVANDYEYDIIDPHDLDSVVSVIDGVKPGGKLTEGWRTDYRQSARLDLDGAEVPLDSMVRVWHIAAQGGETVRTPLATLIPKPMDATYELGRKHGSVDLYSSMYRMGMDRAASDIGVASGTDAVGWFTALVEGAGGVAYVAPGMSGAFGSSHVWECGDSRLSELHRCAKCCGGRVDVDGWGRIVLEPYQAPRSMTPQGILPATMIEPGVKVDPGDLCNRVICSYESGDVRYFSHADLSVAHPWSWQRLGYVASKTISAPTMEEGADVQAALDQAASDAIAEVAASTATWSATSLYSPDYRPGTAWHVAYSDSPGSDLEADCFVSQREITLDAAMETQLTLEVIANG